MLHEIPLRPVLFLVCLLVPLVAASAGPLPAETYAALPQIESPRLSPDGRAVAMISPRKGRAALRIWHNDGTVDWFSPTEFDQINWVAWKGSDRLLFSLRATEQEGGRQIGLSRLVFVGLDDRQTVRVQFRDPTPAGHVLTIGREPYRPPNVQDRIISMLPDDPGHILLAASNEDMAHPEAVAVDVHQGSPRMVIKPAGNVIKWLADRAGIVRLKTILRNRDDGVVMLTYQVRDGDHDDWRFLYSAELDRGPRFVPLAFSPTGGSALLVLTDGDEGRLALREMDTHSLVLGPALAADPRCDIEPVMRDQQVAGYVDPCRDEVETYFDAGWQKDQAMLQRSLKTPLVAIVDRTPDGRFALVKSSATPTAPPIYWYFDQSGDQKVLVHLADSYEGLPADAVEATHEVIITARDGTLTPAFLTLPRNSPSGPGAFIVLPHGGPMAHDAVQFDWIVQFLVSRGYGVLQPQFRGSTGYGASFQRAGYGQWGRAMQDDVTDATNWLVAQHLADPQRLCIVGSSYGGYAALMGAAQHPDLYRCAIAIAPVTDMERLLHDRDQAEFGDIHHSRVAGGLEPSAIPSPLDYADRLSVPVMLVHGRRDFTVPAAHTETMAAKLTQAGRAPTVILLDESDHFFSYSDNRLKILKAMEGFLGEHLGGDPARRS